MGMRAGMVYSEFKGKPLRLADRTGTYLLVDHADYRKHPQARLGGLWFKVALMRRDGKPRKKTITVREEIISIAR